MTSKAYVNGLKIADFFIPVLFQKPFSLFKKLASVQVPTLIIHGEEDPVALSSIERIQSAMPHATLIDIPRCGHFTHIEQPHLLLEHLQKFLSDDSPGSS